MPLYHLVGHSYGGHALGLLPRQEWIDGAWTFAPGAGWHGWMPALERLRVLFLSRLLGPAWTRMAGYLPWSRLGMGATGLARHLHGGLPQRGGARRHDRPAPGRPGADRAYGYFRARARPLWNEALDWFEELLGDGRRAAIGQRLLHQQHQLRHGRLESTASELPPGIEALPLLLPRVWE